TVRKRWNTLFNDKRFINKSTFRFILSTGSKIYSVSIDPKIVVSELTLDILDKFSEVFCNLPCGMNHPRDALFLRVYKDDRFSLLKQCHVTKKIEIWVTKNKINVENGGDVVWMNLMALSIPNFPGLVLDEYSYSQPSYFIDDKRLVLCSCDETGYPWIYVVEENKLVSEVQLNG
ncbi:hypothetical protein Bca52824_025759, partial [Brassica carinata]